MCSDDVIVELTERISDLEAKLAEVKNSCDYYMKRSNDLVCEIGEYKKHIRFKGKEITELKQQLAEKDQKIETILKENEELVKKHNVYTWGDEIQQDKIYAITGKALKFLISNQDKISFAVELLEKVEELVKEKSMTQSPFGTQKIYANDVSAIIDSQIKAIKGREVV